MEMDYQQINQFLEKHKELLIFPGLMPTYVKADALRDEKLTAKFFVYQNDNQIYYHPFHISKINSTPYSEIISAYGYGGPIANTHDQIFLTAAAQEYKRWCAANNVVIETIRFHPLANNWRYYHGDVLNKRNTVFVDLQNPEILSSYAANARWAIRKAIKNNVTVHAVGAERFLNIFPQLYYDRMKEVNAREFYFFNQDYFNALCAMENSLKLIAVYNEQIIGASIFLLQNEIMEYHLSANISIGKTLRAINLILHEAFFCAKNQNCRFAHLGGGISAEHDDPLFIFKMSFAGKLAYYKIGKFIHNVSIYEDLIANKLCEVR